MTEDLILKINALTGQSYFEYDRRSLLHAYVACLKFSELCNAIIETLDAPADVRLALRRRLIRLLETETDEACTDQLAFLIDQAGVRARINHRIREVVDALYSAILIYLPPNLHYDILEGWVNRGNRRSMGRWLKATRERPETFDANVATRYWLATKDARAAKGLAYLAEAVELRSIIRELVEFCEEGWIVARAITRLGDVDDHCWNIVRTRHPATYLYLCAKLKREVSEEDAYKLVCRCSGLDVEGGRGLAIWAVGQMGMVSVLDKIQDSLEEIQRKDISTIQEQRQIIPVETAN